MTTLEEALKKLEEAGFHKPKKKKPKSIAKPIRARLDAFQAFEAAYKRLKGITKLEAYSEALEQWAKRQRG